MIGAKSLYNFSGRILTWDPVSTLNLTSLWFRPSLMLINAWSCSTLMSTLMKMHNIIVKHTNMIDVSRSLWRVTCTINIVRFTCLLRTVPSIHMVNVIHWSLKTLGMYCIYHDPSRQSTIEGMRLVLLHLFLSKGLRKSVSHAVQTFFQASGKFELDKSMVGGWMPHISMTSASYLWRWTYPPLLTPSIGFCDMFKQYCGFLGWNLRVHNTCVQQENVYYTRQHNSNSYIIKIHRT